MTFSYAYDDAAKKATASRFKTALRKVAKALGLTKEQFDLRFNPGGIAVWGEVTLHTDTLYIQASKGCDMGVLVRTCNGRKDYCGGRNNYLPVALLLSNPEAFALKAKSVQPR
jgi:hypothetical protein